MSQVEGRCSAQGSSPNTRGKQSGLGPHRDPPALPCLHVLSASGERPADAGQSELSRACSAGGSSGRAQSRHLRDGALGWGHAGNPGRGLGAADSQGQPPASSVHGGAAAARGGKASLRPHVRGDGTTSQGPWPHPPASPQPQGQALRSCAHWDPAPRIRRVKASLGASPQGWLVGRVLGVRKANTAPLLPPREVSTRAGPRPPTVPGAAAKHPGGQVQREPRSQGWERQVRITGSPRHSR